MSYSPEAKLATDDVGVDIGEAVVTDSAPVSVVADLQKSFTLRLTSDKSHVYNGGTLKCRTGICGTNELKMQG